MPFSNKWQRNDKGPGFMGKIKDTVKPPTPIKVQIETASRQIRVLIAQLDGAVTRVRQRDQTIFAKIVASLAKHDAEHASVYANELSEVRKVGKVVTQASLALEQIVLRLATITDLGEIATTLAPAVAVIKSMKVGLGSALPEADKEIGEISGLLSGILVEAGSVSGFSLNFEAANEDAQKVLDEAAAVAEQRMEESFPQIPAGVGGQNQQEAQNA
ncbi:MAG: Snf7 family protein [Nitrososphaerales archaeon]|nr:Snf7 family protein [Nitrososphaerales archaeon]